MGPDLRPRLEGLSMPVYLPAGEVDAATPIDGGREIAEHLPNARLEVLPEVGRFVYLEAPEQALPAIRSFLSEG